MATPATLITRTVKLSPKQAAYRRAVALYRGFVGGRGAGKSWVGAYDLIRRARRDRTYLVASPTGILLEDTTYPTFKALARELNVWGRVKLTPYPNVYLTTGAVVRFRTAEDPERMRGPNLSGAWLDEASLMDEAAFSIVIGSLREVGEQGWLGATFTPKGKQHWTCKVFGLGRADTAIVNASTADNPFNPPDFQATLARQYTTAMQEQELSGLFIDPPGSMFKREWFKRIVAAVPVNAQRTRYWDKAATDGGGDWTVGLLMASTPDGLYYVEHVERGQWNPGARNAMMKQRADLDAQKYGRGTVRQLAEEEGGSSGKDSSADTVRLLAGHDVRVQRATGSKVVRAEPFAAQCEAGNVLLVSGDWNEAYLDELGAFPGGAYDDQVDASSGAFNSLVGVIPLTGASIGSGGRNISKERLRDVLK